jgi:hypothetical protein
MENYEHAEGVKKSIEEIIGVDTSIRRKKKSEDDLQKEKFIKLIQILEEIEVRSMILGNDLDLDFTKYDEKFYNAIDLLLGISFCKEACEVIFYYLYERIGPDGSPNDLLDASNNVMVLTSPSDLWELVKNIQDFVGKTKKK